MKRNGILNSDISRVLSYMGHTDRICIGDCGLPIPDEAERIDLALKFGQPRFMEVLREVGADMKIEKIVLAEEIKENNPDILREIQEYFAGLEFQPEVEYVSHVELKVLTKDCKAVIRTGETGCEGNKHVIEYSLKLDSNPEFTGSVLVAYARAAHRLSKKGESGARSVFDIAPAMLSQMTPEELRAHML